MRVCILGSGLSSLTLAKSLVNQKIYVDVLYSKKTFLVNNLDKDNTEELEIKVIAKNINTRIEDKFTLMVDPEFHYKK